MSRGHRISGCGRSAHALSELRDQAGTGHLFREVDVVSEKEVARWAAETLSKFGPPDLVINNAAVINKNAPLWSISAGAFSEIIDINIKGVANVIRHFVPAMVERKHGVIVNFSSGWGRSAGADVAPYCATKWAIEGLTLSLAQELPSGMAAVPLNPGIIDTEMLRSSFGASASAYSKPRDWAKRAVPFLLSLSHENNGMQLSVPE